MNLQECPLARVGELAQRSEFPDGVPVDTIVSRKLGLGSDDHRSGGGRSGYDSSIAESIFMISLR